MSAIFNPIFNTLSSFCKKFKSFLFFLIQVTFQKLKAAADASILSFFP